MIPFEHHIQEGAADMAKKKAKIGGGENTAVLYARVSTLGQAEHGVSLDAQIERLQSYAHANGLDVVAVLVETGVSGGVPLGERPQGGKLIEMVESGEVRNIICWKLDRCFRSASDALVVTERWDKIGAAFHVVDLFGGQAMNTASPMGKLLFTMTAAFAELEKNLISERTRSALSHKRAHGKVFGSTPYGQDRLGDDLYANPEEQSIIERMRAMRESGATLRAIADALNDDGIPSKRGGTWYASSIRCVLENGVERSGAFDGGDVAYGA